MFELEGIQDTLVAGNFTQKLRTVAGGNELNASLGIVVFAA